MDVRCERCNTEYEFDDALVSGRGTTVKCTNCGHKFKIRRSDGDYSEDFWNVTTSDGRTLVFTSLRELQRAIQSHLVERGDKLVYCAGALAAIYEKLGGTVLYAGKPYAPIYALALKIISDLAGRTVTKDEVLAIGDGVNTDIAGAAGFGIDAIFVASGLHVPANSGGEAGPETLDERHLAELFADAKRRPLGAMRALAW